MFETKDSIGSLSASRPRACQCLERGRVEGAGEGKRGRKTHVEKRSWVTSEKGTLDKTSRRWNSIFVRSPSASEVRDPAAAIWATSSNNCVSPLLRFGASPFHLELVSSPASSQANQFPQQRSSHPKPTVGCPDPTSTGKAVLITTDPRQDMTRFRVYCTSSITSFAQDYLGTFDGDPVD